MKKVTLAKLSVCPCGFPLLNENIPLGTEYEIEDGVHVVFTLTCGGCKTNHHLPSVYAARRGNSNAGWLPAMVFSNWQENREKN